MARAKAGGTTERIFGALSPVGNDDQVSRLEEIRRRCRIRDAGKHAAVQERPEIYPAVE